MAPEQTMGEKDVDHQADVWALGVILYECLAGVRPIQGSGIGQVVRQLAVEGIRPLDQVVPGLPREVTALVMQMLERERKDRTKDVREARDLLSRVASRSDTLPSAPDVIANRTPIKGGSKRVFAEVPVDTQGAQSVPNGVRPPPRRSAMVGVTAAGVVLVAFAGWRLSTRAPSSGSAASAVVGDRSSATATTPVSAGPIPAAIESPPSVPPSSSTEPAPPPHASASSTPPQPNNEGERGARGTAPAAGRPKLPASASASATNRPAPVTPPAASFAPSTNPTSAPGGLAERPPF
jgi:serine/threonine-protein kinase